MTPVAGVLIFIVLYIIAALLYPGGSNYNKQAIGFSWTYNYWCNLLNETALNGRPNTAQPVAFAAMIVLAITLYLFWHHAPRCMGMKNRNVIIIRVSGMLAMVVGLFLSSPWHDTVINVSSALALVAMGFIYAGLFKHRHYRLFVWAMLNLALMGFNNYLYYTDQVVGALPVVQKITFLSILLWIAMVCIALYRKQKLPGLSESFV